MKIQFVTLLLLGSTALLVAPNVAADPLGCAQYAHGVQVGDRCNYVSTCVDSEGEIGVGVYYWEDDEEEPVMTRCITPAPEDETVQPCPPGKVGQNVLETGQPCIDPTLCEPEPGELYCGVDDPTDPAPTVPHVDAGLCSKEGRLGVYAEFENVYLCVRRGTGNTGNMVCLSASPDGRETCF